MRQCSVNSFELIGAMKPALDVLLESGVVVKGC